MAEKPSVIDTRRDQIFPVLGSHDFARLKRFGEIRTFAPGTALMKAGEVAPGLAFVLKGTIDVRQGGAISQRLCQRQDPDHYALGQLAAPLYIAAAHGVVPRPAASRRQALSRAGSRHHQGVEQCAEKCGAGIAISRA